MGNSPLSGWTLTPLGLGREVIAQRCSQATSGLLVI